jgi:hypothetical protein
MQEFERAINNYKRQVVYEPLRQLGDPSISTVYELKNLRAKSHQLVNKIVGLRDFSVPLQIKLRDEGQPSYSRSHDGIIRGYMNQIIETEAEVALILNKLVREDVAKILHYIDHIEKLVMMEGNEGIEQDHQEPDIFAESYNDYYENALERNNYHYLLPLLPTRAMILRNY